MFVFRIFVNAYRDQSLHLAIPSHEWTKEIHLPPIFSKKKDMIPKML